MTGKTMGRVVRVTLRPRDRVLTLPRGTLLRDALFEHGVEFPCGGRGQCGTCRVRVESGELALESDATAGLSAQQIREGWRLACRARVDADVTLDLDQWESPILADAPPFVFAPTSGLGIAVDVGTTTLAAQLVDRATGQVLGVRTALNPQGRHGADVMTRIQRASTHGSLLTRLVREKTGVLVDGLLAERAGAAPARIVLVGNTAMHHLFCGIDPSPLATMPFEPADVGLQRLSASELGWPLDDNVEIVFLPCVGGFVGSDVLAGILATGLASAPAPTALVDLGTNGEVVMAIRGRIVCASTAAGPAFEGARISIGMRASTGAISAVSAHEGRLLCQVIGGGPARGICGSGLVDALAVALALGWVDPSGALAAHAPALPLGPGLALTQRDVREVQLAKGAIAAGLRILAQRCSVSVADVERLYLAGAFGNYVDSASACRIGLLPLAAERIRPAGNTALMGAKLALFEDDCGLRALRERVEHVPLHADSLFADLFAEEMAFPSPA